MTRALLPMILFTLAASPRQPAPVPLVTVHAVVTSTNGEPVPVLSRDEFEVLSDDVGRPVETFVARNRPTVALMFDVSASVFTSPGALEEAATCLADGIDARDRVRVGSMARHLMLGPVRSDRQSIRKDLAGALHPEPKSIVGPSPIWDAVAIVAANLAKEPEPRAILLVTDGRATGNRLSLAEAAGHALEFNVAVHVVFLGPPEHASIVRQDAANAVIIRPAAPLASLTHYTGGILAHGSPARPAESLTELFVQLRNTYTLGFRPASADGKMHRLTVRTTRDGLKVHAPAGHASTARSGTQQKGR
jgi:VWFA-related protein